MLTTFVKEIRFLSAVRHPFVDFKGRIPSASCVTLTPINLLLPPRLEIRDLTRDANLPQLPVRDPPLVSVGGAPHHPLTSPQSLAKKAEAYQNVGVRSYFDAVSKNCDGDFHQILGVSDGDSNGGFHQILEVIEKAEEEEKARSRQLVREAPGQLYENVTVGSADRLTHTKVRKILFCIVTIMIAHQTLVKILTHNLCSITN